MPSTGTTTRRPFILGVGEILWDLLPSGRLLGGAPANFAYHAHALGAESYVVSRVGSDPLGTEILEQLRRAGLRTDGILLDAAKPTGTVSVALDAQGTPSFTIHEDVAWDFLQLDDAGAREVSRADALCFGTLAQRHPVARHTIGAVLAAAPATALRVFDINLRQHYWSREIVMDSLQQADVFKLNDSELPVVARMLALSGTQEDQVRTLAKRFDLRAVALTKGAQGSALLVQDHWVEHPGSALTVVDTVGAGDSYTAALVLGLLLRHEPPQIIAQAHRVADFVCTRAGAMPPLPPELRLL